ncbi:hypothetical protein BH11PSE12_BH11PSE12_22230 [soil metagenome]
MPSTRKFIYRLLLIPFLGLMLTACSGIGGHKVEEIGGVVNALNYSGREVEYIAVEATDDPSNSGGGDALNPYEGGGDICCFSKPAKWTPELAVTIKYRMAGDKVTRRALTHVTPYTEEVAGQIWLIFHPDESVEAVVSRYDPDRDEWPGKIKGYPVASREYSLKRLAIELRRENDNLAVFEKNLRRNNLSEADHVLNEEVAIWTRKRIAYLERTIAKLESNKP